MTTAADRFYTDPKYKKLQSDTTKGNWKVGIYNFRRNLKEIRTCLRPECNNTFMTQRANHKKYCSMTCAAIVNNKGRRQSEATKQKISLAVKKLPACKRGNHFSKPKVQMTCLNCRKTFNLVPYLSKTQKYCSIHCNIAMLGRKTTSPKASKGKNGIRQDIDPNINFYSTWEANVARVYNLVDLKWKYAPTLFDLGEHTYRPDFYLTSFDTYVEIKNFMSEYSKMRDNMFRRKFPDKKLDLILKETYLEIKTNYKDLVEAWEN